MYVCTVYTAVMYQAKCVVVEKVVRASGGWQFVRRRRVYPHLKERKRKEGREGERKGGREEGREGRREGGREGRKEERGTVGWKDRSKLRTFKSRPIPPTLSSALKYSLVGEPKVVATS